MFVVAILVAIKQDGSDTASGSFTVKINFYGECWRWLWF